VRGVSAGQAQRGLRQIQHQECGAEAGRAQHRVQVLAGIYTDRIPPI
jgi:hypothetical protein